MEQLPRELWIMILKWKSKMERRERYKIAKNSLELLFERVKLTRIIFDDTTADQTTTYQFKASNYLHLDLTVVQKYQGFTIHVMSSYNKDFEKDRFTQVWVAQTWGL